MSFRFSSQLTATLQHRILWARAERRILGTTYVATVDGVRCVVDGRGAVVSLTAAPGAQDAAAAKRAPTDAAAEAAEAAETPPAAGLFRHADGQLDTKAVARAAKRAAYSAMARRQAAKEEEHRRCLDAAAALKTAAGTPDELRMVEAAYHDGRGQNLRPHAYEMMRDAPLMRHYAAAEAAAASGAAPVEATAALTVGAMRADAPLIALTNRAYAATLLHLDPAGAGEDADGAETPAAYRRCSAEGLAAQRVEAADSEAFFWRRVGLIRQAQRNALRGSTKRQYAAHSGPGAGQQFLEKVELNLERR